MTMSDPTPPIGPRQFFGWFLQPHPLLGWTMVPRRQGWYTRPEIHSFVRINSHGFRGQEFALQKQAGTHRIVLLADSFGVGAEVDEERTFARSLEANLNSKQAGDHKYEVVNTSVGGYGTEQHSLFLHLSGKSLEPDWVVLGFHFGDDVIENSKGLRPWWRVKVPRPHLDIRQDGSVFLEDLPANEKELRQIWMHFYDLLPWEIRRNAPLEIPTPLGGRATWGLRRLSNIIRNNWGKLQRRDEISMYLLMFARPAPPLLDAAWERTARFLGFLARTTASLGARLLVVGVCTKEQIWRHYFEQRLSKYPRLPFQFDPYYPNERLQRILAQQHIPYLDLMPIFEHNTELGQQLFFNTDLHWNERGHALAAEHIARTISTLEQEDQFANTPVGTSNHLD